MSLARLAVLGAPGIYPIAPDQVRAFTGQRMDVCAFVGVAPRGPCREPLVDHTPGRDDSWRMADPDRVRRRTVPVAVESFDAYRRIFGGFEGPGLLPYAVSAFFEQGGRKAYVARIVHDYDDPAVAAAGAASGELRGVAGTVKLRARSEGAWGDKLKARIGWTVRPLSTESLSAAEVVVRLAEPLQVGDLLRLRLANGSAEFRFVIGMETFGDPFTPTRSRRATLESAASAPVLFAEVIEASLSIVDSAGMGETHDRLGLHAAHSRWLATVLCRESQLAWPDWSWAADRILPEALHLPEVDPPAHQFSGGVDRYADLRLNDMFDPLWVSPVDSDADGAAPAGVQALAGLADLTQIVVPDLYQPATTPPVSDVADVSLATGAFAPCFDAPLGQAQAELDPLLSGLQLDPALPLDLAQIVAQQQKLVAFVEATREQIVLLDVPPGLKGPAVQTWRGQFDSAYAAAYHPWPELVRDDARITAVPVPPSAIAAGVIADRERRLGLAAGPANVVASQAVRLDQTVTPELHAVLHPQGINVLMMDVQGVRLTAARTLARDPQWRQLSVRRLVLMLRRALKRQMEWAVFEPNGPALRRDLQRTLTAYLRRLYIAGAFTGDTEDQAFFVRCDDSNNPAASVDAGQLLVEIGIAPAEPLEFILLRIVRSADGDLVTEEDSAWR